MKAIVQPRYGPASVLELRDVAVPTIAADGVLVRVRAASVHPDVWHVLRGHPYVLRLLGSGLRKPRNAIPGTDLAGEVEAVGERVALLRPGDRVFGQTAGRNQWANGGAFAEYAAVPERALATVPAGVGFAEAAAVPASGLIAVQALFDQGRLEPGQRVLINGAGGGVGLLAVQLAAAHGAIVTGVDTTQKLDAIRAAGAVDAIDFARDDFTRASVPYDLLVDIPGNRSIGDCRRALAPRGRYVFVGHDGYGATRGRWLGSLGRFLRLLAVSPFTRQVLTPRVSRRVHDPLDLLRERLEAGTLRPLVERTYPLAEAATALGELERGQVRGKLVLLV